jgi:signal transduction histidine kinase
MGFFMTIFPRKNKTIDLKTILYQYQLSSSLIPIIIIGVLLFILYFHFISELSNATIETLLEHTRQSTYEIASREAKKIEKSAQLIQEQQQQFFINPQAYHLSNDKPIFATADNGVFYKVNNNGGSSLYYSSKTEITEQAYQKAFKTESFDPLLKSTVLQNENIVAAYFNSHDNMVRYYPFIDNVAQQFGEHISLKDFNFYYEADAQHNPARKAVWTNAYLDTAGKGWMLSCVIPIYRNDFLEGVSGIDVTIEQFADTILDIDLPWSGSAFLVNREGIILAMPEEVEQYLNLKELKNHNYSGNLTKTIEKSEKYNLFNHPSPAIAQQFKTILQQNIEIFDLSFDNHNFLLIQAEVSSVDWRLLVLIDKEQVYDDIYKLERFSKDIAYNILIFIILFFSIFFYYISRKLNEITQQISNPIVELATLTSNHSALLNTQSQLVQDNSNIVEISTLTCNFNLMVERIKTLVYNLEQSNQNLEQKIHERTLQLERKNQQLLKLNQEKNEFLSIAAHDLKNPLQAIQGSAELISISLQDEGCANSEELVDYANMIDVSSERMFDLITNLLDVNAIEEGKFELNLQYIDILPKLNHIVEEYREKAQLKSVSIYFEPQHAEYMAYTDVKVLHQILDNLISNAVKYSPFDKHIFIKIFNQKQNIRIEVQDQGQGLSQEEQTKLFTKFTRLSTKPTNGEHSTGLGLFIVKKLVTALKSEVWCESEVNQGTTFILLLPVDMP